MNFKVVEKFVSINGEGTLCGQLAVFIRFAGCNLNCSYCDTKWANEKEVKYEIMNSKEIYDYVKSTRINNVTLTGGEPLMQQGIAEVIELFAQDKEIHVEIETNGSVAIDEFRKIKGNIPKFTLDYKLPSSGMEQNMVIDNYKYLKEWDTVKFVVGSLEDLQKAKCIIYKYDLIHKANVYISPVFGQISMENIVDFMKANKMNGVNLQAQLHKIIWSPDKRGV
ncbi:putative 7-carboxy-7-deazaguanine synthase QueE [Haloimpatiens sp. FM7330]|uniref:putative 7-carboxy-7-deazaguanine synthase QueE n=1 Tax=Haloimpatiens sp. FM7330 TaxID=3298610 RepID=UPI0036374293